MPIRDIQNGLPETWTEIESRVLAGVESGVYGGLGMSLFLGLYSALRGQLWWSYENLLGSIVYGNSALFRGYGRATLAGFAVQVFTSGLAGVVFSLCFARTRGRLLSLVEGLGFAMVWYVLLFRVAYPAAAPLVPIYAAQPATLIGHVILGLVLARAPRLYELQLGRADGTGTRGAGQEPGIAEIRP